MALRRPELTTLAAVSVALLLAATAAVSVQTGYSAVFLGAAAALGGTVSVALAFWVAPIWPLAAGVMLSVFSGNSQEIGLPIGPDRLLLLTGLAGFVIRRWTAQDRGERPEPLHLGGVHWILLLASLWAIGSAYWAGTLLETEGLFRLIDTLGLLPFALFAIGPVLFASQGNRDIFLKALVALAGYLGVTALAEGLGLDFLVFPKYILDPSVGIHADRARGPFVEAEANGLALYAGVVACAIGFVRWSERRPRVICVVIGALCAAGILFTLSRGTWLAAVAATVATAFMVRELRRYLLPAAVVGAGFVLLLFSVVPGLSDTAGERAGENGPLWVRVNTNHAAVNMIRDAPLVGHGWQTFKETSGPYFEQADAFPMYGPGEGCHNVFLANAAELGLPGAFLWFAGLLLAVGGAILRRSPPELRPWKIGLLAYAIAWLTIANIAPLTFSFPTLLLWMWAGILWVRPTVGSGGVAPGERVSGGSSAATSAAPAAT